MYKLATAPRGIGQVLDSVFKLTRAAFVPMLPYAILGTLVSAVPFVYIFSTGMFDDPVRLAREGIPAGYWLMILVLFPVSMILYGAGIARIESITQGADIGFGRSFGVAAPKVGSLVVGTIGFALAVALGFALLLVPGLILLCSLFLFMPAIVLDGKGPIASLNYSHKLVWGNWWRVATTATIAVIIIYVFYVLVGVLAAVFVGVRAADPAFMFMLNMVTTVVGGLLVTTFFYAVMVEIYREVKMRKTGGDLAARIAAVGTAR